MTRLACLLLVACAPQALPEEKAAYRRGAALECTIAVRSGATGWSIESATRSTLTVQSRYNPQDMLLGAEASAGGKSVAVTVEGSIATVRRQEQQAQQFEVPGGVIVTSAPDWTDVFLLCRRYDRARGGKQEFPGLWIHPVQAAQRLTFTIEKTGHAAPFDRFSIVLRGNSRYTVWADEAGRMVKLVGGGTELVCEGFETPAANLKE